MTKDPVCGMQIDEKNASATSSYQGQKYVFHGKECKEKFDKNPEHYTHGKAEHQEGSSTQSQGKQHEHQQGKQPEKQQERRMNR
jgi:YHS domain-containing protein